MSQKNAINWFEIPSTDLPRAEQFYEKIFNITLTPLDLDNIKMRMFPTGDETGVGGAICFSEGFYKPSATDGPLIYLNANPDIQAILDSVQKAGGKILTPRTQISDEFGFMAVILDSEGNRIGLHSMH